ncbi:glycerate kinase-like [Acipenser oxyrinchus oxyrinchus]|uniref:Glycerate kinase n=1 Tax=Acipenser oxyrinchus oxyrinchus TaxID=40147 RepID=A0AAD8G0K4_ACIOX|nr:glycerate kinase-like [Acipenser oxyrinchus oxyrinchus]
MASGLCGAAGSVLLSSAPWGLGRRSRRMMTLWTQGREVFGAAVSAVLPENMMRGSLALRGERLLVDGRSFAPTGNVHLVGFGKAVLGMAAVAERILGDHLVRGVVSVPHGIQEALRQASKGEMLLGPDSRITVLEGARHNLPDREAMEAASAIRELASGLTEQDLLLVLISGGGSALLPAPTPPITLEEKQSLTRQLAARGATIQELNTLRKALSQLKGGGLARCAHPAQVVSLILSDVIADPPELIASGPTVPSPADPGECWAILERYGLRSSLPQSVRDVLSGLGGAGTGQGQAGSGLVHNAVIGSNTLALEAASARARELGFLPVVLSPAVCGEVQAVSRLYGLLVRFASQARSEEGPEGSLREAILGMGPEVGVPDRDLLHTLKVLEECRGGALCLLSGGEPTVQLRGKGKGGRNQELALRVAVELAQGVSSLPAPLGVAFLSGGTDGQDGPTDAAGAIADPLLVSEAREQGLDPAEFLDNNDSYTFFTRLSGGDRLIQTGLTGTNVMDVHLVLIQGEEAGSGAHAAAGRS